MILLNTISVKASVFDFTDSLQPLKVVYVTCENSVLGSMDAVYSMISAE